MSKKSKHHDVKSRSRILLTTFLLTLFLISSFSTRAYAFTNGQSASLVIGQNNFTSTGHSTSQTGFNLPGTAIFDSSGNMWVADVGNNRILEFKPPFAMGMQATFVIGQGDFTTSSQATTQNGLAGPFALAFDSSGDLWVTEVLNNRVVEFRPPFSLGMSASIVIGQSDFTHQSPGSSKSGLLSPDGLAFDQSGNLWVGDQSNNRVLEFKPPFADGMDASLVIGQPDFETLSATTTQAGLNLGSMRGMRPLNPDVAFDPSGNLWVSDDNNNRVLEFKPPFANGMNAYLVIGQPDFVTAAASGGKTGLFNPAGIAFDSGGNLWVADLGNNRVLEFQSPFNSGMAASLVIGQQDFASSTPATTQNGFSEPHSPRFDSSGNLWVSEGRSISRILEFTSSTSSSVTTTSPPTTAQSTPSTTTLVQSSQTSVTSTTTNQAFGQLIQIAAGVAIVVVAVGLIAVFLLRSRRKSEATRTTQTPLSGSFS